MKVKSSLLASFGALAVAMTFIACSNDNVANTNPVATDPVQVNYAPAKASKIQITSGEHLLASAGVTSRGCDVNHNEWDSIPAYPTEAEKAGILAYLATKPEGVEWPGYTTYLIQHVTGAHHMYSYKDMNGALHENIDGTSSMEQLQILENSGNYLHTNNFNAGKGNNNASHDCNRMTDGFNGAKALNEYSGSDLSQWKIFYWEGNYYLGLDFHLQKGDGEIAPDGCYDDWVVKIIPINGEKRKTPYDVEEEEPLVAHVEVNLALNEQKPIDDYISSKLSIHVRDTTDVEVFLPIPADLYCQADDMYIIKNHEDGNYAYGSYEVNEREEALDMRIAGQKITLTIHFYTDGIKITTTGINATVLKELREQYGDGLTFEIWNYYDLKTNRAQIQEALNKSWCRCNTDQYINTVLNDDTYKLDCIVSRKQ